MTRTLICRLALPLLFVAALPAQESAWAGDGARLDPGARSSEVGLFKNVGVNVYGQMQTDGFFDSGRVDPVWNDTVRPSTLSTSDPNPFGSDGEFDFSARASIFGVKSQIGDGEDPIKVWFEFDVLDVDVAPTDTGKRYGLHLRHAWGEWGSWGVGQTWSAFTDITVFPDSLQYWGPCGMVINRNVQFRWTHRMEGGRFVVALEDQNQGIDEAAVRAVDPNLNVSPKSNFPDIAAHWRRDIGEGGHVQVAGVLRQLAFDAPGTPGNPDGDEFGFGVSASGLFAVGDHDAIKAQATFGNGIASFINDGGSNLAPKGGGGGAEALQTLAGLLYWDHRWSPTWSSSLGYSVHTQDTTAPQVATGSFETGSMISANVVNRPNDNFAYSVELFYLEREDANGLDEDNFRVQFTFQWKFSGGSEAPKFDT